MATLLGVRGFLISSRCSAQVFHASANAGVWSSIGSSILSALGEGGFPRFEAEAEPPAGGLWGVFSEGEESVSVSESESGAHTLVSLDFVLILRLWAT